jgi:hypothetical protein
MDLVTDVLTQSREFAVSIAVHCGCTPKSSDLSISVDCTAYSGALRAAGQREMGG